MEPEKEFVENVTRLDRSSFDLATGLRAGIFVVVPFLFAPVIGDVGAAFAALNGMWLTNTEGPGSKVTLRVLLVACLTESAATGLGTLAGATQDAAPVLVGLGVFFPMLLHGNPRWTRVGTFTAIAFAVGVGFPGSFGAAAVRTEFSLLGTLWVLLGIAAQRRLEAAVSHGSETAKTAAPGREPAESELHPDALRNALTIGAASAVGIAAGIALSLPRDFWVVVTIILTVQPSFNSTLTFTSSMVLGTIVGAVVGAAAVTLAPGLCLQLLFLTLFAVIMYETRGVNTALVQVFLAPFVIVLLDLVYAHQANFPEARVVDVAIGGAISVATVYVLGLDVVRRYWTRPAPRPGTATGSAPSGLRDLREPGFGAVVVEGRSHLRRADVVHMPPIGEGLQDLLLGHPPRSSPPGRFPVGEAEEVATAAGPEDGSEARGIGAPLVVGEDVEEPGVDSGVELAAQVPETEGVCDQELRSRPSLRRLRPGLLYGERGGVDPQRLVPPRCEEDGVLAGSAAYVDHVAPQGFGRREPGEHRLGPPDVPGRDTPVGLIEGTQDPCPGSRHTDV